MFSDYGVRGGAGFRVLHMMMVACMAIEPIKELDSFKHGWEGGLILALVQRNYKGIR